MVNMLLQADDVLLVALSHEQLQRLLTALYKACERWQLVINLSKIGTLEAELDARHQ